MSGKRPDLPRTERDEAPLYLARYLERANRAPDVEESPDDGIPLYLRRFRRRRAENVITAPLPPLWERSDHGMQMVLSEDNRNKEIGAPPEANRPVVNDVYLVRHAETQGYSTEAGITPLGAWQARTVGHTLARRVGTGEKIVLAHAATNRAGQTIEQLHRGVLDGLELFEKDVKVAEPQAYDEFRNFMVATPDGIMDVTAAFRLYYSVLERFERIALGDRPAWLVEIDRFWRTQYGGGDPIQHWLTVPMLHFEPPALCIRRFWTGIRTLAAADPGARIVIATHSGPIRAFAVWAFGYDPGEPYNTEHVRVKLMEDGQEALVVYRNRVQEVNVPEIGDLPSWSLDEQWIPRFENQGPRRG